MNGRQHASTGLAAAVATAPLVYATVPHEPIPLWIAAVEAGSILPDADHPSASIAWMWGPITRTATRLFSPLVGGHRGLTHRRSVAVIALVGGTAAATLVPALNAAGWMFFTGVFLAASCRLLRADLDWRWNFGLSLLVGIGAYVDGWPLAMLGVPLAVGVLVHIAGDGVKEESVVGALAPVLSWVVVALVAAGWAAARFLL